MNGLMEHPVFFFLIFYELRKKNCATICAEKDDDLWDVSIYYIKSTNTHELKHFSLEKMKKKKCTFTIFY